MLHEYFKSNEWAPAEERWPGTMKRTSWIQMKNKAEPKAGSEEVNTEAKHEELNATVNIDREQRIHSGSGSIITLVQICQEPNPGLPDQTNKSG